VAVWGLLTALVLAHMPVGGRRCCAPARWRRAPRCWALPVMVVMFVLFPRIGPLWGLPQDAAGRTGLSGTLRLGGVASMANDDSIAMRVRFFGPAPDPDQLYFRGPVLSSFDGREWTRLVPSFAPVARPRLDLELRGAPLRYELTLEPSRLPLLPLLEITPDRPTPRRAIEGWHADAAPRRAVAGRPPGDRTRARAGHGLARGRHGPRDPVLGLRDLVACPAASNPRTLAWAPQLRATPQLAGADARTLAARCWRTSAAATTSTRWSPAATAARHRRVLVRPQAGLLRTLCQRLRGGDARHGRAGAHGHRLPGHRPDPQDGYWIVRQSQRPRLGRDTGSPAKAGCAWTPRRRWRPSASASRSLQRRAGAGGRRRAASARRWRPAAPGLGAVNNRWNQWVLNYAPRPAVRPAARAGLPSPRLAGPGLSLLIGLLCSGQRWPAPPGPGGTATGRTPGSACSACAGAVAGAGRGGAAPPRAPRTRAQLVRARLGERGEPAGAGNSKRWTASATGHRVRRW
jgi:hypothetical protein